MTSMVEARESAEQAREGVVDVADAMAETGTAIARESTGPTAAAKPGTETEGAGVSEATDTTKTTIRTASPEPLREDDDAPSPNSLTRRATAALTHSILKIPRQYWLFPGVVLSLAWCMLVQTGFQWLPQNAIWPSQPYDGTEVMTNCTLLAESAVPALTPNTFFEHVRATHTNITAQVEACPELCPLLFGTGNPDLTGIGMLVAYMSQLALLLLHAPVYYVPWIFIVVVGMERYDRKASSYLPITQHDSDVEGSGATSRSSASAESGSLREAARRRNALAFLHFWSKMQDSFWNTNLFFAAAIAIAIWYYATQNPSFYEQAVMQHLILMQISVFNTLFACTLPLPPSPLWEGRTRKDIVLRTASYLCVMAGLIYSASLMLFKGGIGNVEWKDVSRGCQPGAPDVDGLLLNMGLNKSKALTAGSMAFVAVLIIAVDMRTRMNITHNKLNALQYEQMARLPLIVVNYMCAGYNGVQLLYIRIYINDSAGPNFQDNDWGFGQVMALLTWCSPVLSILYNLLLWVHDKLLAFNPYDQMVQFLRRKFIERWEWASQR